MCRLIFRIEQRAAAILMGSKFTQSRVNIRVIVYEITWKLPLKLTEPHKDEHLVILNDYVTPRWETVIVIVEKLCLVGPYCTKFINFGYISGYNDMLLQKIYYTP